MIRILTISLIVACACFSCAPISKRFLDKSFRAADKKFRDHIGFILFDLDKDKTLYEHHSAKYFLPASNTKIFTLFACLTILTDSIPALKYSEGGDSLIFWGTGDPSFLYKEVYDNGRIYSFLKGTSKSLYYSDANFQTTNFGKGWAWDDYNDYYSSERSALPVYGNMMGVRSWYDNIQVLPDFFKNYVEVILSEQRPKVIRRLESNDFTFHSQSSLSEYEAYVPFKVSSELTTQLLSDTLKKMVRYINKPIAKSVQTLYSVPVDSLYKVMMQESDNFIAEQLLLVCSQALSDSLKPEIAIRYVAQNFFGDLADKPQWVDGSGLSRYNLVTPRSVVQVWQKIYQRIPRERLFSILATGGRSGTIKNWYKSNTPYIFGKTGSLSNNHNLSGYLVAKSGKTFIFSFMNNNFTSPVNEIRKNMEEILKLIYERY
jgi:D-alanyl-D-alanine carboxypeptidase/D-alanyl-D-alanine-endopeptidase (penicillin-binding protein 4)